MTTAEKERLYEQIAQHEGLELKLYLDTKGIPTIGYGRNLRDKGITSVEAMYLLRNDVSEIDVELARALPWFRSLDAVRQRALIDMGMMGVRKLLGFRKMLAAIERGDWATAKAECLDSKWARDVKRRRATRIARMIETGEDAP